MISSLCRPFFNPPSDLAAGRVFQGILVGEKLGNRFGAIRKPTRTTVVSICSMPIKRRYARSMKADHASSRSPTRTLLVLAFACGLATVPADALADEPSWKAGWAAARRLGHRHTWVALGGETVSGYSIAIRQQIATGATVLGYTNNVMAYIPTPQIIAQGQYIGQASMAVYGVPAMRWSKPSSLRHTVVDGWKYPSTRAHQGQ